MTQAAATGISALQFPMTAIAAPIALTIDSACPISPTTFDCECRWSIRLRRAGGAVVLVVQPADARDDR